VRRLLALAALTAALLVPASADATNRYISTTGLDTNPCTSTLPCKTFNRGYQAAAPGDLVYVSPGSYPGQNINGNPANTSATDVTFHGLGGVGGVTVTGYLNIYAHDITLRYMRLYWHARPGAHHIRLYQDLTSAFFITSANYVTMDGGEVGPNASGVDGGQIRTNGGSTAVPTGTLIKNVKFHDITRPAGSGLHTECLHVGSSVNLTLLANTWTNCATQDVFIRSWGTDSGPGTLSPLTNIRLEGNNFGPTLENVYVAQIKDDLAPSPGSFTVINNTCSGGQTINVVISGTMTSSGNVGCGIP
jgi:hypothetical protein